MDKGNFVKVHIPCPCGQSSDAYCENIDKSGHCFSCDKHFFGENKIDSRKETARYLSHRGISEATMRYYGVKTKFLDDIPFEIGFRYPSGSLKIRSFEGKVFRTEGPMKEPGLFGKDKFDPGSKESITICEGEFDALSITEATRFRTAGVSVRSGVIGQAMKDCIADRDYINSFKRIILCFDNDDTGQRAAREISSLFDFNKLYNVKFTKYKDANDYFQADEVDSLIRVWENAKRYSPDNIISSFSDVSASLKDSREDMIGTYPFNKLQDALYGLHKGEVIVFKGMSGIGKTEVFRAMEHHLLKTTKANIGIIHMEEDNGTTVKAIAGYELGIPATLPDIGISNEDILEGYRRAVGGNDSRVHLYSSFEMEDENVILDNIRFLATAADCQFIFLDHITWLATGMKQEDERLKLDRLSQKLKLLAKELRFCLIMISHTNDDGRTRGSRNIENVANTMVHLERDKKSADSLDRRITSFMIEKARLGGHTGPAGIAILDLFTGILRNTTEQDFIRTPDLDD